MALIDDIEFYGSRVDAGDIDREKAAQLLAEASEGGLTLLGAKQAIDTWQGVRERMRSLYADVVDAQRALANGRPVPEHVQVNRRARQRARLLEQFRRRNRNAS
jgi:hypothetical protein